MRVRDCIPTIIYTIFLKFSFTPTSPSTHAWEVLSLNTYLTQSECWEKFWYIWEALEEVIKWWMQFGVNCGIRITSEDMTPWSLLVAGTWRYIGWIRFEGSFWYSCTPTFSLVDQFRLWGPRKDFLPSTSVSSSITHFSVILCLYLSSLLFKLYIYYLLYMIMPWSSVLVLLWLIYYYSALS